MNLKNMPKDIAAEILGYLAENEEFESIEKLAGGDVSIAEVRALLREISGLLAAEAASENKNAFNAKNSRDLSKISKDIISSLSPREERQLLSTFGLIDKQTKK
ncbi:MAG: hypothetical protein HYY43_06840 [Deltaproteobacteria bacterium]|nr:hypothetical protein [Deltaproteobacteria bacterium]MBI2342616.1 hypothetical protein [Deltaproteobacteria bacterium]MBI2975286.1 hypothetical protein [Deltaproteobacteria bacterium]